MGETREEGGELQFKVLLPLALVEDKHLRKAQISLHSQTCNFFAVLGSRS